jgi:hypothetical protein
MKTIKTEIDIQAPAETVWEMLSDIDAFPSWNRARHPAPQANRPNPIAVVDAHRRHKPSPPVRSSSVAYGPPRGGGVPASGPWAARDRGTGNIDAGR